MNITRTTVAIDSGVLTAAKRVADEQHRTLGQLVTAALQRHLVETASPAVSPVALPTFGHGGLRPGVDLNSNAELSARLNDESDKALWSSPM